MLDTYVMISDNGGGIHYRESLTSSQQEKIAKGSQKGT